MKQEPEGFEELWQIWRRHARKTDGRGKARPTYIKWLNDGASPRDIIDGATCHIRTMAEKDRPYINLLSVYINSERWADECEDERAYRQKRAEVEQRRHQETNVVRISDERRHELVSNAREALRRQA